MILVGATMARFATDRADTSLSWLNNAQALRDSVDDDVEFFAALEVDGRGGDDGAFDFVKNRLETLGGAWVHYRYDDYREKITTANRLWHICMGRNIIQDVAMDRGASHTLFLDADMEPPPDAVPKLLELGYPIVGGEVPTYGLHGPTVLHAVRGGLTVNYPIEWNVQEHMNTAGFLLVQRQVFSRIRWRWSLDDGQTDDPAYERDVREFLHFPTFVRHDTVGRHFPESILPIEDRFPERDMSVAR